MTGPVVGAVRLCFAAGLALLVLQSALSPTQARDRDLGTAATTGVQAVEMLPDRQKRVISELACGSEAKFIAELRNPPKKRPLEQLTAKAAALSGATSFDFQCEIQQEFDPEEWNANFLHEAEVTPGIPWQPPLGPPIVMGDAGWPLLKEEINKLAGVINDAETDPDFAHKRADQNGVDIARLVNRVEQMTFGDKCASVVSDVASLIRFPDNGRPGKVVYLVTYTIGAACLQEQIAAMIIAPDFRRTTNPGTGGLRCAFVGETEGDWDMTVIQLTRTAFFLRKTQAEGVPLTARLMSAIDKLQNRLLTLSGEPADNVHSIAKCGNDDNKYGSAMGRLNDDDFDDPDLGRMVEGDGEGGSTGLDFLGGLLLALAFLLLGAAIGTVAAILSGLLGPLLAAIVLAAALAISAVLGIPQTIIGSVFGGIEETENHLFMQNSSKLLKNKMLLEELYAAGNSDEVRDAIKEYEGFNKDLHNWFMERLQRIADEDFAEYNAKPYVRLSTASLLNVYDFACEAGYRSAGDSSFPDKCSSDDRSLTTGTALVLDLAAIKAALGSNEARRIAPFRRLAHANTSFAIGRLPENGGPRSEPFRLLGFGQDADHMLAALQLWTGMTFHGPSGMASSESLGQMMWEASSNYAPRSQILDVAIDKLTPYQQTFRHAGWERYSSGPGWLLTAGGTSTGYAQGFRTPFGVTYPELFIKQSDRGAGVPTTLIVSSGRHLSECPPNYAVCQPGAPLIRQDMWRDFIRFEGKRVAWAVDGKDEPRTYDGNFCVNGSFACGINLQIPSALEACLKPSAGLDMPSSRVFRIGDTSDKAACAPWFDADSTNDVYVVLYSQNCAASGDLCARGDLWGFLEVVPKTAFTDRAALAQAVLDLNWANFDVMGQSGGLGTLTYQSIGSGTITFDPAGSFVRSMNGARMDETAEPGWGRATGPLQRGGGIAYTFTHPKSGEQFTLDFAAREAPNRDLP